MAGSDFRYDSVVERGATAGDWTSYVTPEWMMLSDRKAKAGPPGWSVVLSVAPDQVPRAWDAIGHILRKHRVQAKCAREARARAAWDAGSEHAGHSIVLRAGAAAVPTGCADWRAFLELVESELSAHDIEPGPDPRGCRPVAGSAFMGYRHDAGVSSNPSLAYAVACVAGPFHAVALRRSGTPRPMSHEHVARRLEAVHPGWIRMKSVGWSCRADDAATASDLARCLASVGAASRADGATVVLGDAHVGALTSGWHDAVESFDAVLSGRTIQSALVSAEVEGTSLSLVPRRSDSEPPAIGIRGMDPALGAALAEGLEDARWTDGVLVARNPAAFPDRSEIIAEIADRFMESVEAPVRAMAMR